MIDIKQKSLQEALTASGCNELPPQYKQNDKRFWLKAIALVKKKNMTQSYVLAERRSDGAIIYTKDFGMMSPIAGLVGVYPYIYLDHERYMPDLDNREKAEKDIYYHFDDLTLDQIKSMDSDTIKRYARQLAMDNQDKDNDLDKLEEEMRAEASELRKAEEKAAEEARKGNFGTVITTESGDRIVAVNLMKSGKRRIVSAKK